MKLPLTRQPPKQKKLGCCVWTTSKVQSFYSHGGTVIALDYASDLLLRPPKIGPSRNWVDGDIYLEVQDT